jgi:hypothetical protein
LIEKGKSVPEIQGYVVCWLKVKDLSAIPGGGICLRADGWYLSRYYLTNPIRCQRGKDRCTKEHEYIFLLCKSPAFFMIMSGVGAVSDKSLTRVNMVGLR